jgi:hypothetical protein
MDSNLKAMIESIAREIVNTWNNEKTSLPKVLFIFCDSTAHEPFSDQFIQLQNNGICHDLLFLDGETSSWLGMSRVECSGAGKVIAADEYAPAPLELPKEYDAVIVPEIDLDNAARVVAGLKGTIKAEIIFSALVLNKPVIIGEDVPGLKRSDRRTLKTVALPPAYQKLFQRYMNELRELGIDTVPQKNIAETVIRKLNAVKRAQENSLDARAEQTHFFSGKLLTADWVKQQNFSEKVLHVRQGTILSPLALDVLKEKGIQIQYAGGR